MSEGLKSFLVFTLAVTFFISWVAGYVAGMKMAKIMRKDGRSSNDLLRDFLRNPNELPLGSKAYFYTYAFGLVTGFVSLMLLIKMLSSMFIM